MNVKYIPFNDTVHITFEDGAGCVLPYSSLDRIYWQMHEEHVNRNNMSTRGWRDAEKDTV